MADYFFNSASRTDNDFEVFEVSRHFNSQTEIWEYLGEFATCEQAIAEARRRHPELERIAACPTCPWPYQADEL